MKQLLYRLLKGAGAMTVLSVGLTLSPGTDEPVHACSGDPSVLSIQLLADINQSKADYQLVETQTQVPWELLAAIHYRETNFSRSNPSNGQGIFQFVNGDGGPYPPGPVSDAEFRRQLKFMANRLQSDYVFRSDLSYPKRHLRANNEENYRIKDVLFSYNGRASVYAQQAAQYGFNSNTQPYEGSPYVMNRFDCQRASMGIITMDFGSLDGKDTRYGAFTIYSELTNGGFEGNPIVTGDQFDPSRLMSNKAFYENGFIDIVSIQKFLNSQVTDCDNSGDLPSEFGGGTRAEYATSAGFPPPFRCLKGYIEDPTTHENNVTGNPDPASSKTAARIFWEAGANNGINPQVLIALVQAEKKLINDDWPWSSQYEKAAGIDCPGSLSASQCADQYEGFYNQVNKAAEMLKDMADSSMSNTYDAYGTYSIPYNASGSCGSASTYIANEATAALYNFNPYRPNQDTINDIYGTENGCETHDNLDLWAWYSNWFGSIHKEDPNVQVTTGLNITPAAPYADNQMTATFTVTNNNDYDVAFDNIKVLGRGPNSIKANFPSDALVVPANGTATYSENYTPSYGGDHNFWISAFVDGKWNTNWPISANNNIDRTHEVFIRPNPVITTGISLSDPSPIAGDDVTAAFTVENNGSSSVNIGDVKVAVRDVQGNKQNFPTDSNVSIPAGGNYTYSETRSFPKAIRHDAWIITYKDGSWHDDLPQADLNVDKTLSFKVDRNPFITTGLQLTTPTPHINEDLTATFTVTNYGNNPMVVGDMKVSVLDRFGNKHNFPTVDSLTVPANGTYTYSESRTLPIRGRYSLKIVNFADNRWLESFPAAANGVNKELSVFVEGNPTLTSSPSLDDPTPNASQNVTLSYTFTNFSGIGYNLGDFKFAVRDQNGAKFNFPTDLNASIPANGTYTYSETRSFPAGTYSGYIVRWNNNWWDTIFPLTENPSIKRTINFTVSP